MWADSLPAELQGSPRILEWVAYRSSRGSPWPRNRTGVSCLAGSVPAQLQGSPSPLSSLSFKAIFHWNLPPLLLWGSTLSFSHQTPRPFYLYVVCYSVWNLFMFHGIRYNVSFFFKCLLLVTWFLAHIGWIRMQEFCFFFLWLIPILFIYFVMRYSWFTMY